MLHKSSKIILMLSLLLTLACTKQQEGLSGYEPYDTHPYWTDSTPDVFWDKQQGDSVHIDTAWGGDYTI